MPHDLNVAPDADPGRFPAYPQDGSLRGFARAAWRGTTNIADGSCMGLSFHVFGAAEPVRLLLTVEDARTLADVIAGYLPEASKANG